MGRISQDFAQKSRPKLLAYGGFIYRIRRIKSDDLAHVGHAHLEGSTSVKEALEKVRQEADKARTLLAAVPTEERERRQAMALEHNQALNVRRFLAMTSTPQGEVALLDRATAYILAAVDGMGRIREGVEAPRAGLVEETDDPAEVLEDLRSEEEIAAGKAPIWIEPIRFVAREEEHDADAGRIWVHHLPRGDRMSLGLAIIDLQDIADQLVPFRLCARGSADARHAGETLPGAAARGAGDGAVSAGNRADRRAAGRGGRRKGRDSE